MAKSSTDKGSSASAAEAPSLTMGYEDAMKELESIVQQLESGSISLEESLKAFERGRALSSHCRGILDAAAKRIQTLSPEALAKPERE
jgi:exodeoxyribonuclease VII small subunit